MNSVEGRTTPARVAKMLEFERYFTRRLQDIAASAPPNEMTAGKRRVFRELSGGSVPLSWLEWRTGMDAGYLSRTVKLMELEGFVAVSTSELDRRERDVTPTRLGLAVAGDLQRDDQQRVRRQLEELPERLQRRLLGAMTAIRGILERDWTANLLARVVESRICPATQRSCAASCRPTRRCPS